MSYPTVQFAMNVVQAHRPAKIGRAVVGEASNGPAVQFYDEIPNHEMSLDDFEVFALSRLKVRDFIIL